MEKESVGKKKRRLLKAIAPIVIAAAAFFLLVYAYEVNSSRMQCDEESDKNLNTVIA